MDAIFNDVLFSRLQFASTAMFHILWPVLTIGLSLIIVILEVLWFRTRELAYYHHLRFWSRLFVLNFAVGTVTGIPMEFQFGTNWSAFSVAGGDIFGHLLGFEAAMAFMLEACFLAIMLFGWNRVSPRMHLVATCLVAFGSSLSAFWIMVANSWMHTPTGGYLENGRFVLTSHIEAIFNPDMPWGVSHMWAASVEISAFVFGGLSAWYLLRGRHVDFFLKSFRIAALLAFLIAPLQIWLGDGSGGAVFAHQPAKLAAIEAHWHTNPPGVGAPWHVLAWPDPAKQDNAWELNIPNGLSLITTRTMTGQIKGLREFPVDEQPPVLITFYAFRIMIATGFLLAAIALWTVFAWARGRLSIWRIQGERALLASWIIGIPLSYIAMETGWITREMGRQPWIIYGMLRTDASATQLALGTVGSSLFIFTVLYALLFVLFLIFARRILTQGPNLSLTPPGTDRT